MDITSFLIGYKKGQAGGGGLVDEFDGLYWRREVDLPSVASKDNPFAFVFNDELYIIFKNSSTTKTEVWKLGESEWAYVCDTSTGELGSAVELNGVVYLFGYGTKRLYMFDGMTVIAQSDLPAVADDYNCAFVFEGELYASLYGSTFTNRYLYKLVDGAWTQLSDLGAITNYAKYGVAVVESKAYWLNSSRLLYCYDGNTVTQIPISVTINANVQRMLSDGKAVCIVPNVPTAPFYKLVEGEIVECMRRLPMDRVWVASRWAVLNGRIHLCGGQYNTSAASNALIHMSCAMG